MWIYMPSSEDFRPKHETKGLKWRSETPGCRKRAPEITDHEWNQYRGPIMRMHQNGLTRKDINASLLRNYGFQPTRAQLVRQLGKWGLSVYKERNAAKSSLHAQQPMPSATSNDSARAPCKRHTSSRGPRTTSKSSPLQPPESNLQPLVPKSQEFVPLCPSSAGNKFEELLRELEDSKYSSAPSSDQSSPSSTSDCTHTEHSSVMLAPASPTFSMISFEEYAEEIRQNQSIPQVWMVLGTSPCKHHGTLQLLWHHILSWIGFLGWICHGKNCRDF